MEKGKDVRLPSAEETEFWLKAMKDADPLQGEARRVEPPPPPPSIEALPAKISRTVSEPLPDYVPPVPGGERVLPKFAGIDKRSAERLRRGEKTIEAKIDLHGMTRQEAHTALIGFLFRSFEANRRCVLVVTGKGNRGAGVLRGEVPRWLQIGPVKDVVLAISPAQPKHGGEGALYVLIKRRRE